MSTGESAPESPRTPSLRIVSANATPEEVAALTAVFGAMAAATPDTRTFVVTMGGAFSKRALRPSSFSLGLAAVHARSMNVSDLHVILASGSPARQALLRSVGIEPFVRVSGVDEDAVAAELGEADVATVALALARAKGQTVLDTLSDTPETRTPTLLIAADSILDFDSQAQGKPSSEEQATLRWQRMRGREGVLVTGHFLALTGFRGVSPVQSEFAVSTVISFGDPSDAEIAGYVASGEPLEVAGGCTIDALGSVLIDGVNGDHTNVIGLSLPTLRKALRDWGVAWDFKR